MRVLLYFLLQTLTHTGRYLYTDSLFQVAIYYFSLEKSVGALRGNG